MEPDELQAKIRELTPKILDAMDEIMMSETASATERLRAVQMLIRAAVPGGPAADTARQALKKAGPVLASVAKAHKSAKIKARAQRLAQQVNTILKR